MMSIAIMADGKKTNGDQPVIWAKTRLGQCLIIVELIRSIRELIKLKRDPSVVRSFKVTIVYVSSDCSLQTPTIMTPTSSSSVSKVASPCYWRIRYVRLRLMPFTMLTELKEAEKFIPFSQRLLLSTLLLEIRLYTRSVKP